MKMQFRKNHIRFILGAAFAAATLTSCEEDITLDLPEYEPRGVLQCVLTPENKPSAYVTFSKGYFDYKTKEESQFVRDARVVLHDVTANTYDTLKPEDFPIWSQSGQQLNGTIYKGQRLPVSGHKYRIDVLARGKQLMGETFMAEKVQPLSWTSRYDANNEEIILTVRIKDAAGSADAYRLGYHVPMQGMRPVEFSAYQSDQGHDGEDLTLEFPMNIHGRDTSEIYLSVERLPLPVMKYFESIGQQYDADGNPFAEPVMAKSNITGGLGVFGAITPGEPFRVK